LLCERASVHPGPDLSVNRDRVQIANPNLGFGLRNGRCGNSDPAKREACGRGQKLSSIHGVFSLLFL
jgi:hypothetical protein